jgi:hypothetical protein
MSWRRLSVNYSPLTQEARSMGNTHWPSHEFQGIGLNGPRGDWQRCRLFPSQRKILDFFPGGQLRLKNRFNISAAASRESFVWLC